MKIKTAAKICTYCTTSFIFVLYSFFNSQFERNQIIEYKRISGLSPEQIISNTSAFGIEIFQILFLNFVPPDFFAATFGASGFFLLILSIEKIMPRIKIKYAATSIFIFCLMSDLIFQCIYSISFQFISFLILCISWITINSKSYRIIGTFISLTFHISNMPIAAMLILSEANKRLFLISLTTLVCITSIGHGLKMGPNNFFGLNQLFPEGYLLKNYASPNWILHASASGIIVVAWFALKIRSKKHKNLEPIIRLHEILVAAITIGWTFSVWIGNFHRFLVPAYVIFCCLAIAMCTRYGLDQIRRIRVNRDVDSNFS